MIRFKWILKLEGDVIKYTYIFKNTSNLITKIEKECDVKSPKLNEKWFYDSRNVKLCLIIYIFNYIPNTVRPNIARVTIQLCSIQI